MTTWTIEKVNDRYFVVSTDGDRLEAGHSEAVAQFAATTLNQGIAETEPGRVNHNPFGKGRWTQ